MKSKKAAIVIVTTLLSFGVVSSAVSNSVYPENMVCSNTEALENCVDQGTMDQAVKITSFTNMLESEGGYNPNYSDAELQHEPTSSEIAFSEKYPNPTFAQIDAFWMSRVSNCDSLNEYEDWKECWFRPWLYGF